jgi:hypothetical protein
MNNSYPLPPNLGELMCASALTRLMDHPGMTIEELRNSLPAQILREHLRLFDTWLTAAVKATPNSILTPEERKFLLFWFDECNRIRMVLEKIKTGMPHA